MGDTLESKGVKAEVRISLYRLNPSLACNTIISTQRQYRSKEVEQNYSFNF